MCVCVCVCVCVASLLITIFNNTLPSLAQIIKNLSDILKVNPILKDVFQEESTKPPQERTTYKIINLKDHGKYEDNDKEKKKTMRS